MNRKHYALYHPIPAFAEPASCRQAQPSPSRRRERLPSPFRRGAGGEVMLEFIGRRVTG